MILYNSRLAKCFLSKKKHSFMIFGFCFTRYKYLEIWAGFGIVLVAFVVVYVNTFVYISFSLLVGKDDQASFYL